VILRSNGSLGSRKTPNALRAKGVEKEEEENISTVVEHTLSVAYKRQNSTKSSQAISRVR
jgi:hypothetical protein